MAGWMGIPTLVQEQNSYPGITNKLLAKRAHRICVAYRGMEKFFPAAKIQLTGNPIRPIVLDTAGKREAGQNFFGLERSGQTILVVGGSLGARTINESVAASLDSWTAAGLQVIWQTGTSYFEQAQAAAKSFDGVKVFDFISKMDLAYGAADLIVSRAGAMSISELCIVGKPVILVPSPNVAEDHQTKNAMALVSRGAAVLVKDIEAEATLRDVVLGLIADEAKLSALAAGAKSMAFDHAAERIVDEVVKLIPDEKRRTFQP
jgi:UDP-N-acetylglucosamine--N-acetylmuramyl-(pentapeptide) pyrophosphoryl-undecaprenol N-acetylglucosamine transferase